MNEAPQPIDIEVQLRALAHGGAAVGEVTNCSTTPELKGMTAFVPYTIPGESVQATIETKHKSFVEASLLKILSPSEDRIEPPCPYFGSCGGCNLQHITLARQRSLKLEMVRGYLEKHAGISAVEKVSLCEQDLAGFSYRKRVIFHVNRSGQVGFYHKRTKRIIEVDHCLIALPEVNAALQILRPAMSEFGGIVDDIVIEFCEQQLFVELKLRPHIKGGKEIEFAPMLGALLAGQFENFSVTFCAIPLYVARRGEEIAAHEQEFPVGHFSQVNEAGNQILQTLVSDFCGDSEEITELYAGAGNFTFPLARKSSLKRIVAVEADRELVRYGIVQTQVQGLSEKVEFVRKSCEKYVRKNPMLSCLVVDPPRCGAQEAAEKVDPAATEKIVYVSCALPTLCRDIKILADKGYHLDRTVVVDMFPQTYHVETVSLLTRSVL